jgi:hypothetical protein
MQFSASSGWCDIICLPPPPLIRCDLAIPDYLTCDWQQVFISGTSVWSSTKNSSWFNNEQRKLSQMGQRVGGSWDGGGWGDEWAVCVVNTFVRGITGHSNRIWNHTCTQIAICSVINHGWSTAVDFWSPTRSHRKNVNRKWKTWKQGESMGTTQVGAHHTHACE